MDGQEKQMKRERERVRDKTRERSAEKKDEKGGSVGVDVMMEAGWTITASPPRPANNKVLRGREARTDTERQQKAAN